MPDIPRGTGSGNPEALQLHELQPQLQPQLQTQPQITPIGTADYPPSVQAALQLANFVVAVFVGDSPALGVSPTTRQKCLRE